MAVAVDGGRTAAGPARRRPEASDADDRAGAVRPRGARGPARRAQRRSTASSRSTRPRSGPALGGVRMWHYPATIDAARDALRLATRDDLQGGRRGARPRRRQGRDLRARRAGSTASAGRAALLDFGDLVESLGGRYITAEDVGISPRRPGRDRASAPTHLTGLPPERGGSGDPSPFTAIGVEAAIRACVARTRSAAATSPGAGSRWSGSATSARGSPAARRTPAASWSSPTSTRASARSRRRSAPTGSSPTEAMLSRVRRARAVRARRRDRPRPTRRGCAARSSAARPTTSSPTRRSPTCSPSAGSSTRPTSSPTPAG